MKARDIRQYPFSFMSYIDQYHKKMESAGISKTIIDLSDLMTQIRVKNIIKGI